MLPLTLERSGRSIGNYLSCLGGLKETRLTATFAFLLARFPDEYLPLLGVRKGKSASISIEETDEGDRYDVLVTGLEAPIVVEAKLDRLDDHSQLKRYVQSARRKYGRRPILVVIEKHVDEAANHGARFTEVKGLAKQIRCISWKTISRISREVGRLKRYRLADPGGVAIARELVEHLEEQGMVEAERKEVYCREVGSKESIELYFKHSVYNCQPEYLTSATGNLYFAPYFTQRAVREIREHAPVPIEVGITFISRIKTMRLLKMGEFRDFLQGEGVEDPKAATRLIGRTGEQLIFVLGPAYRLFLSPVLKAQLKVAPTLGSKVFSLERLLEASRS